MEGRDLVVVHVGGDEGLRRVMAFQRHDMRPVDAIEIQPFGIGGEVHAHGTHRHRLSTEQLQVVGDISGTATELAPHLGHMEGNIKDMHLVRQDMVLEPVLEDHDGVIGKGTADQCSHRV